MFSPSGVIVILLFSVVSLVKCQEVSSFTVHILHDDTHPSSIAARDSVYNQFCRQFACIECPDGDFSCDLSPGVALTTRHHEQYRLPMDIVPTALSWIMQFRTARVSSADVDLDIAIHPDTELGPEEDYLKLRVWGGRNHPVDTNRIYLANPTESIDIKTTVQDDDIWAYTCSSDATGEGHWVDLCSSPPWAPGTTCRVEMLGAHIHLYYQQNNPKSVAAKNIFRELATEEFGLDPGFCPDNNGHEEPHDTTCWLSGPGGNEAEYPQNGEGSSFTTGKISLYVTNDDFASVLAWVLTHTGEDTIGDSLDFLLHPCFGCNFADHQLWSLHRGTNVPNNLFGIAHSGGWTGENPPELDPLGPPTELCPSFDIYTYSIHLVFDPTNQEAIESIQSFKSVFEDQDQFDLGLTLPYEEPMSYNHPDNIFLASDLFYLAVPEIVPDILSWITTNMPTPKPNFSVFLHPNSLYAPFENRCDMNEHGLWMGEQYPMKNNFTFMAIKKSQLPSSTQSSQKLQMNFILYVFRAPNNSWQTEAWNLFLDLFSNSTGLQRNECVDLYPALEPVYDRMCMMQEVEQPYMDAEEVMTTSYAGIFIPGEELHNALRLLMALGGPSTLGYTVDFQLIPLSGNPALDYSSVGSFSSGQSWFFNNNVIEK